MKTKTFDPIRISYIYTILKDLYAQFSGEEVAEALKQYRAEVIHFEEQRAIRAKIKELESKLE